MISDVRFYLRLLVRRLPGMVVLFLIASIAGFVISQRLPTMYQTSAKLLVETSQISEDLVRSTVRVNTLEQLEVIQQRLLTRANLIDIANRVGVFPDARNMNPDVIVGQMRQRTRIRRTSGRDRATLMTISFEGENPRKIQEVVNQYVTIVLATNSDLRSGRAEGTLTFFEEEARRLSEDLDLQSAKIVAFKADNSDALPENLDYRLNRQSLLQERLSRGERDLEGLAVQRERIKQIYESTGTLQTAGTTRLTPEQVQLNKFETELRLALGVYSETNPRVRNLKAQIEALKEQVRSVAEAAQQENTLDEESQTQASALDITLAELDARTDALRQEIVQITQELEVLQGSIDLTPTNGIALAAMERDMDNIQSLYSGAVNRLSQARMSDRVEQSGSGERISVLEAATVPTEPSSPNRPKIIATGVGAGLGLAAGFFFLLELINQSIRRPTDIVKAIAITPLATIPSIESAARKRWRRVAQVSSLILVFAGVPALLWAVDTHYMPLDILFEKIKDRLV